MNAVEKRAELGPANKLAGIFLISVLGLFLELLLIRWISTEVRVFAYLQNVVLVVCFLGLGMGCFTCRQEIRLRDTLIPLVFLAGLMATPIGREGLSLISRLLTASHDFIIWEQGTSPSSWSIQLLFFGVGLATTFFLMAFVWDMFVPIGRILGRLFDDTPHTIQAYSYNVVGSLIGTWLFVGLSVISLPPVVWLACFAGLACFFLGPDPRERKINLGLLGLLLALGACGSIEPGAEETRWSPYQKLVLRKSAGTEPGQWTVLVNNALYQSIIDLGETHLAADPKTYPPERQGFSQYDLPWLMNDSLGNVLIVGAGTGNDAAGALRNKAQRVVCVEIDPVIVAMGQQYHPEKPYQSEKVVIVNDDARSYFATSTERFDVISFGLLDSHTTTGGATNARLDHYVYTKESIERAKTLLKDDGVLVLSFCATSSFIADRMAGVLKETFGQEPLMFDVPFDQFGLGGTMFIVGDQAKARKQIAANPKLAAWIAQWTAKLDFKPSYGTPLAVDDWPYIYLNRPRIPILFVMLTGLMFLLFLRGRRRLSGSQRIQGWTRTHWHFFFLGAAFMLLETQNISKASVVLGSTWQVNAVIITGVLVMVLAANAIAWKFPKLPLGPVYCGLCGSCLALYFVDLAQFGSLPYAAKAVVVGTLTTLPMAFSGIVFVRSFVDVPAKDQSLGANMIGALVGGLLQAVTFVTGIKALLLIVTALYLLAFATRPRPGKTPREEPAAAPTPAVSQA